MAETAKELAFALFDQGRRPSDLEVKALGLKSKTTYDYYQRWKKLNPQEEGTTTVEPSGTTTPKPSGTTTPKGGTPTTPITVGKITITLENWGFTEYRAILILDTYKRVQNELKYAGSRSDFLCNPGADLEANSGLR